ncbi:MAG: Rieske 2Fe-2S domain-containing protein [Pseudomonadales bacterium]|nr:Rieske 2Fe-2S domain-containing protein [Pseudomonadales bacterium]
MAETGLLSDGEVAERVFDHVDNKTSDSGEKVWREPVENYHSEARFADEIRLLKHLPVPFCPSAAIPNTGDYVARIAAGTPLVVVRDEEGNVQAFRNACRHRGMQVAQGSGCTKYFVCAYHGWAYRLDGSVQHIPHREGFPDVNEDTHGLVPVEVIERHGLVFVTQEQGISRGALQGLDEIPDVLSPDQTIFASSENTGDVNWKLNMEANLEGLHIKTLHPESFFPYGYDNLNVVESFGNNNRVTFPFRRIEKLRDTPIVERNVAGQLTYVYHLFPNVVIAVLSNHTSVTISEPLTTTSTRFITYRMTNSGETSDKKNVARAKRDAGFLADTGSKEDAAAVRAIQAGLTSGANDHFTFGHYEKAIVHFHEVLSASLQGLPD